MKLYTAKISPFAAMCRIQIYYKGLDVELLELPDDATWGDVGALSPLKKIPLLIDDDLVIPESYVIAEYLEDRFPEQPLRPDGAAELARMRLIARIADQYIMVPLTPLFAHLSRKHRDQKVVEQQLGLVDTGLAALDFYLSGSTYAIGGKTTLADCALVPVLVFIEKYLPFFAVDAFSNYKKLSCYWNGVSADPCIKKVIDEMRQGIQAKARKG